jgi:hypothetical protein
MCGLRHEKTRYEVAKVGLAAAECASANGLLSKGPPKSRLMSCAPRYRAKRCEAIVAPAQRSASANHKARTKQTTDGMTVHSFQTLLAT